MQYPHLCPVPFNRPLSMIKKTHQEIWLVASGDLRLAANQLCWPAQKAMEEQLIAAIEKQGRTVRRAHAYDPAKQHGFIDSQRMGHRCPIGYR